MSDTIERQREIVARHIRGENEHDWEAVYDTFVQDDNNRVISIFLCHKYIHLLPMAQA